MVDRAEQLEKDLAKLSWDISKFTERVEIRVKEKPKQYFFQWLYHTTDWYKGNGILDTILLANQIFMIMFVIPIGLVWGLIKLLTILFGVIL